MGWISSGNSGKGITIPEKTKMHIDSICMEPSPAMVHIKEMLTKLDKAPPSKIAPTVAKAQAAAAPGDAGSLQTEEEEGHAEQRHGAQQGGGNAVGEGAAVPKSV